MRLPGSGSGPAGRRAMTPAVLLAAVFAATCAAASIAFVAAHGGLEVPNLLPAASGIAAAIPSSTAGAVSSATTPSLAPSFAPTPQPSPTAGSSAIPTTEPTGPATPVPTLDPLAALQACADHPGCYEYTIRRDDTLSTIADRWLIPIATLEVLNPQVTDPRTIVVGQILYLGRTPFVRLDPCPGVSGCYRYVVRPGDRLSTIAGRFGLTTEAILAFNPLISDPNAIYSGQTIRLPGPTG